MARNISIKIIKTNQATNLGTFGKSSNNLARYMDFQKAFQVVGAKIVKFISSLIVKVRKQSVIFNI